MHYDHLTDPPTAVRLPANVRGTVIPANCRAARLAELGLYPDGGRDAEPQGTQATGWRRVVRDGLSVAVPIDTVPIPPEPIPDITPRQLRLWLVQAGVSLAAIDGFIDAIDDQVQREMARIEWEKASNYKRSHPLVAAIGAALGFNDEAMDAAFNAAALID